MLHPAATSIEALFEASPDALIIVDDNGKVLAINGETERLFGYERSELVGAPMERLFPQRFLEEGSAIHQPRPNGPKGGRSGLGRERYGLCKDGAVFPAEVRTRSVASSQGRITMATIRDITERAQAEESKFQLAAIVDSSQDGIIGEDLDGKITSWNRGARNIFGYDQSEVIGEMASILVPPELLDEEQSILAGLKGGERVDAFETVRRCKDGRHIHISLVISPIYNARGEVTGASKVARDISERKQGELEMIKALDAIEASNRELEAFSYSVAHDLRAPLRGIDGFSRELYENYSQILDEEGLRYLKRIRASAERMGELIQDLLALARLTRTDLCWEELNLSELVTGVNERLAESHPDRFVTLKVQENLWAFGDKRMVTIALENLLGNAWKFTRNRADGCIEFGSVLEEATTVYYVRDNGAGFDMSYASKLFGVFQRLHTESEFEGTGIGLATVQRIIRRHGGEIWARGEVSIGATFYFSLG